MADLLVFIEARAGKINSASLQTLSEAKRSGLGVDAIVIGVCNNPAFLGAYGVARVHHVTDDALNNYSQDGYATALAKLAGDSGAKAVLMSATAMGRDLAPRLAAKLKGGYAADIVEFAHAGDKFQCKRPVYAGKAFVNVESSGSGIFVATLRPNVFAVDEAGGSAEIIDVKVGAEEASLKSRATEISAGAGGKLDVAEAETIVSGGRGLKGPENWTLIEGLAEVLGAATGASRAVVDAGWRPHAEQVGQTGKTVSPQLYFAVAISGAIQHLAGMSSSKCIVAINKDANAPIFKVADFGIVGDAFEVVPVLTEKLKALKS